MGTNFHWKIVESSRTVLATGTVLSHGVDHMDPAYHIGKRSGAGLYCWDCRVTLCNEGEERIHFGGSGPRAERWYDHCPKCGKMKDPSVTEPRRGVAYACSFSWAQSPYEVRKICEERIDEALIEDEYGVSLTGRQFLEVLEGCPIQYQHLGEWFS